MDDIRTALEHGEDRITDLHVWQVGPDHHAAIVAISLLPAPRTPSDYKARLSAPQEKPSPCECVKVQQPERTSRRRRVRRLLSSPVKDISAGGLDFSSTI